MQFWRIISVAAVLALFYVGHGLHAQAPLPLEAQARGNVHINPDYTPWLGGARPTGVTSSADGLTLHFWGPALQPVLADPKAPLTIHTTMQARVAPQLPGLPGLPGFQPAGAPR
jgi:hypothetical protein